jgi:hypothetical protein
MEHMPQRFKFMFVWHPETMPRRSWESNGVLPYQFMKPVKHWLEELDDCIDRGAVIEAIQADARHAALTEAAREFEHSSEDCDSSDCTCPKCRVRQRILALLDKEAP